MGKSSIDEKTLSQSLLEPQSCCSGFGISCEGDSVVALRWQGQGLTSIDESINELTSLTILNLSQNALSGSFPEFLASGTVVDL